MLTSYALLAAAPPPIEIVNNLPRYGWGSPTVWTSLIVALVALVGVLISNRATGRNMIRAEDVRAKAALEAEGLRAANTIAAENLRAERALEAEAVRHRYSLDHASQNWLKNTKSQAYFQILQSAEEFRSCSQRVLRAMEPVETAGGNRYKDPALHDEMVQRVTTLRDSLAAAAGAIASVGDRRIATVANRLWDASRDARSAVMAMQEKAGAEDAYADAVRTFESDSSVLWEGMLALVREDLLGESKPAAIMKVERLVGEL